MNGAGTEFEAVMPFVVENAESVTVTVDPSGAVSQDMVGQPDGVAGLNEEGFVPSSRAAQPQARAKGRADQFRGCKAGADDGVVPHERMGAVRQRVYADGELQRGESDDEIRQHRPAVLHGCVRAQLEQEAYALIAYVDTADGQLVATCWGNEKPAVNLTLIFEGGVD